MSAKAVVLATILHMKELQNVNDRFNKFDYIGDFEMWGKADYWQSPAEFEQNKKGDCEDYAIAKYNALLRLGLDESRIRLAYVVVKEINEAHMVLIFQGDNGYFYVLDNMVDFIEPLHTRKDLMFVYSFNTSSVWIHKKTGDIEERPYSENLGPVQRLRKLIHNKP